MFKYILLICTFFIQLQINDKLQENYNSVDFVEVEQVDDNLNSRQLGVEIIDLRQSLVNARDGSRTKIPVLFHYDNMR